MRRITTLFTLILMLFAIVFAVSNRFEVPLAFWPFPFALETPLFLIAFAFFVLGFVLGWLNYFVYTRPRQATEIKDLRERLFYLKEHSVLQKNEQDETGS